MRSADEVDVDDDRLEDLELALRGVVARGRHAQRADLEVAERPECLAARGGRREGAVGRVGVAVEPERRIDEGGGVEVRWRQLLVDGSGLGRVDIDAVEGDRLRLARHDLERRALGDAERARDDRNARRARGARRVGPRQLQLGPHPAAAGLREELDGGEVDPQPHPLGVALEHGRLGLRARARAHTAATAARALAPEQAPRHGGRRRSQRGEAVSGPADPLALDLADLDPAEHLAVAGQVAHGDTRPLGRRSPGVLRDAHEPALLGARRRVARKRLGQAHELAQCRCLGGRLSVRRGQADQETRGHDCGQRPRLHGISPLGSPCSGRT
jgi:hypothetical protein